MTHPHHGQILTHWRITKVRSDNVKLHAIPRHRDGSRLTEGSQLGWGEPINGCKQQLTASFPKGMVQSTMVKRCRGCGGHCKPAVKSQCTKSGDLHQSSGEGQSLKNSSAINARLNDPGSVSVSASWAKAWNLIIPYFLNIEKKPCAQRNLAS